MGNVRSARLKIFRAAKHLKAIKACIADYASERPYTIVKSKRKDTVRITIRKPPPAEISILAGEMIYQMRSALDHLIFELIKSNPTSCVLPPKWDERCEFSIKDTLKPGQTTPLAASNFEGLPGLSMAAFTFIESVQPYYNYGAVNHCLRFLRILSNIDKHRRLQIVIGKFRKYDSIRLASGLMAKGFETLHSGAEFPADPGLNGDPAVSVNRRYRATVHFDESSLGNAGTLAVDYILKLILDQIRLVIFPAFEVMLIGP